MIVQRIPLLDTRTAFDEPTGVTTATGGQITAWAERISGIWAGFRYLRGGEVVLAARLSGKQPAVVTVRLAPETLAIKPHWRLRNLRDGQVYQITAIVPTASREFLEITCEATK